MFNNAPIKYQETQTLTVKDNGRSSDFVTPNFIYNCQLGCRYCYVYRWQRKFVYFNENVDEILNSIHSHSLKLPEKVPNQVDDKFWTYDIGCSTDISLYWNRYPFDKVLKFFRNNNLKSTFATKVVNNRMIKEADANYQNRIRFSLMPTPIQQEVEIRTSSINSRIQTINLAKYWGWDVHLNFSPVIYYDGWLEDYKNLFKDINELVHDKYKDSMACEVIFLTHNEILHNANLAHNLSGEELLWTPEIQETKYSQYGGKNVRYKWQLKNKMIQEFKELHQEIIPWCNIRYIF
jgi:spore photoproduct lyase